MMNRRFFLKNGGIAVAGLGLLPSFLARAAMADPESRKNKILIAIFQRGAVDGLNMVVPFGERAYYALRPSLAIPAPVKLGQAPSSAGDAAAACIDLDGFFGLHPALNPLKRVFDDGHLAVVHAAGSPDSTRSHFDAQDFMESGTPGVKGTADGWLNRHLASLPKKDASPFRAVTMGPVLPRTLRGPAVALAMTGFQDFQIRGAADRFEQMYGEADPGALAKAPRALEGAQAKAPRALEGAGSSDLVSGTGREMIEAIEFLKRANPAQHQPAPGVEYPRSPFGNNLRQIAQLIKAGVGLEVAFTDLGGWDTHVNQGGATGQLAARFTDFSQGLAALYADLGDRMADVVILTMSEFGRTAAENGNRGTDHGHANAMFVIGGAVRGGKVYGKWPGLAKEQLNEGRDLALTTDFREVFGEVIYRHLGNTNLKAVFPGFAASPDNFRGLLKA